MQILVEGGHSWSDLKKYTLSEVGIFLVAVIRKSSADRADSLRLFWLGNNLKQGGLKELTKKMEDSGKKKPETPQEIANEWQRLKAFFAKG